MGLGEQLFDSLRCHEAHVGDFVGTATLNQRDHDRSDCFQVDLLRTADHCLQHRDALQLSHVLSTPGLVQTWEHMRANPVSPKVLSKHVDPVHSLGPYFLGVVEEPFQENDLVVIEGLHVCAMRPYYDCQFYHCLAYAPVLLLTESVQHVGQAAGHQVLTRNVDEEFERLDDFDLDLVVFAVVDQLNCDRLQFVRRALGPTLLAHGPEQLGEREFHVVVGVIREVLETRDDERIDLVERDLVDPATHAFERL